MHTQSIRAILACGLRSDVVTGAVPAATQNMGPDAVQEQKARSVRFSARSLLRAAVRGNTLTS